MKYLYLLILIVEVLLLPVIPTMYSRNLCVILLIVFILLSFFYLLKTNRFGLLSFDFLFLIGLLATCFLYPVFRKEFTFSFAFSTIDSNIINKATLLSLIGSTSFMFGSLISYKRYEYLETNNFLTDFINKRSIMLNSLLCLLLLAFFLFNNGLDYKLAYASTKDVDLNLALGTLDYFKIFFLVLSVQIFIHAKKIKSEYQKYPIVKNNIIYLAMFSFIVILLLIGGTRNMPIQLTLIILGLYNILIKKISNRNVILMVFVGFALFTFLRYNRLELSDNQTSSVSKTTFPSNLKASDYVYDLVLASAPLYNLVSLADNNGMTHGGNMLLQSLSVFPFAQSLVIDMFELDINDLQTSSIVATKKMYGSLNSGAGTSIIADLYYSFGLFGIVIFMFVLGIIVTSLSNSIEAKTSIISLIAYVGLFSTSIFYARVEYLYGLRYISWAILIFIILMQISKLVTVNYK